MASGCTSNYGLCQWQGEDKFLREEFNQDNEKIDAALGGLRTDLDAAAYNVYNLILQNYYEGKYTGFKRGLLFDGFLDESGISMRSDGVLCRGGSVGIYRQGMSTVNISEASGYSSMKTAYTLGPIEATGAGLLTRLSPSTNGAVTAEEFRLTVYLNNVEVAEYEVMATVSGSWLYLDLPEPLPLLPGDRCAVVIQQISGSSNNMVYSKGSSMDGTLYITPKSALTGSMSTLSTILPGGCKGMELYLRHSGGTLTPTLNGGDLELVDQRTAQGLLGQTCTLSHWTCTGDLTQAALSFRFACGTADACLLYSTLSETVCANRLFPIRSGQG